MEVIHEIELRRQSDQPTQSMLDMWHKFCLQNLQKDIEVVAADRRSHSPLKNISGEFNTAFPDLVDGKLCLVLWLDSVSNLKQLVITHELGHWVLKYYGFKVLVNTEEPHQEIETNLNSLAQHPPLFSLQKSLGHNSQEMIDLKAQSDISSFKSEEEKGTMFCVPDALLAADDVINCSERFRLMLFDIIKNKYPNTRRVLDKILKIAEHYDLQNPLENLKFSKWLVKDLRLGSCWVEFDEIQKLREEVK